MYWFVGNLFYVDIYLVSAYDKVCTVFVNVIMIIFLK